MLASRAKRLAELERALAATHEQAQVKYEAAIWAQFSDDELEALIASVERRKQRGYVLTEEEQAIDQRWHEAVQAVVPEAEWLLFGWQTWALAWGKAVKSHA